MSQQQKGQPFKIESILIMGLLLMAAYYCADAAMDAIIFDEGHFWQQLKTPSAFELSIRLLGVGFLGCLTLFGYYHARRSRKLEAELRRQAKELKDANDNLEAFSYTLTHDLRGPLSRISTASQLLPKLFQGELTKDQSFVLYSIDESCTWMGKMIQSMLTLGKVSCCEINPTSVDLSQMARTILEAGPGMGANPAEQIVIAPGMVATTDEPLTRIVLENLLGNARKFSSKIASPKIELGSNCINGQEIFFVRDNGDGFDMINADKLFNPFVRLHGETEFTGNGIGLATAHRIIERLGGKIWAESAPGQGATFHFTFSSVPE